MRANFPWIGLMNRSGLLAAQIGDQLKQGLGVAGHGARRRLVVARPKTIELEVIHSVLVDQPLASGVKPGEIARAGQGQPAGG